MARREDKIQIYRVCDQIIFDKPTYRIEMRLASSRRDGSIMLAKPFPGLAGVIFPQNMIGVRVFLSPSEALEDFVKTQEREIELAQNRVRSAADALLWALDQK